MPRRPVYIDEPWWRWLQRPAKIVGSQVGHRFSNASCAAVDRRAAARRACLAYLRIAAVYSGSVAVQPRFSCAEHRHSQQLAPDETRQLGRAGSAVGPQLRAREITPRGRRNPASSQTLLHFGSIIQLVAIQFSAGPRREDTAAAASEGAPAVEGESEVGPFATVHSAGSPLGGVLVLGRALGVESCLLAASAEQSIKYSLKCGRRLRRSI